ncbi:MAG: multidrug transporter, partial [Alphaproteobacteria bacterium]|nr:multidrug transporter [Alphaproteobacteria bacterium]
MNAPVPPAGNEAALRRLSAMLQLQRRARRAASVEELAFVTVNETHALVPYRQAALFRRAARGSRIAA